MGVKKSTVWIIFWSPTWITPPSSGLFSPTNKFGDSVALWFLNCVKTWASSPGESLQAQPAPWEYSVNLNWTSFDYLFNCLSFSINSVNEYRILSKRGDWV